MRDDAILAVINPSPNDRNRSEILALGVGESFSYPPLTPLRSAPYCGVKIAPGFYPYPSSCDFCELLRLPDNSKANS
jgi:hypothetical protein